MPKFHFRITNLNNDLRKDVFIINFFGVEFGKNIMTAYFIRLTILNIEFYLSMFKNK